MFRYTCADCMNNASYHAEPKSRPECWGCGLPMTGGRTRQIQMAQWPMISEAMATHPKMVDSFQKRINDAGIKGAEVIRDGEMAGCVKLDNKRARRDVARMLGLVDRSGGYGDP